MSDFSLDDFRLDARSALVTGAGRGIGLAVAKGLAAAGAKVTLAARTCDEVKAAAKDIQHQGGDADFIDLDVLDHDAVCKFINGAPVFDILVNNAGTNRPAPFLEVEPEDYDAIFNLNVRSAFFVAQAVASRLVALNKGGSIINMSSQMGHVGAARRSVYCGSKHAMEGWSKAMAIELGPHNIRVNTVCPTFIETPMTKPFFEDEGFRNDVLSRIHLGRIGQMKDVVGAVVYLASAASSLVTGSALKVDGGWTAD
ncbi:MAG: SDR family oxidoreductase [Pseudomonadota bacterium]